MTEYRAEKLIGDNAKKIVASFPTGVTHRAQYGNAVKAQSVYYSQAQFISYKRLTNLFAEQYSISLSQGSIENFNQLAYDRLAEFEEGVAECLKKEPVIGVDENGINISSRLVWLHSIGSPRFALFQAHQRRGGAAIDERGIIPQFSGVVCHDHWRAYFKYDVKHALCNAHHLRELTAAWEFDGMKWARNMHRLLLRMRTLVADEGGAIAGKKTKLLARRYRKILADAEAECPMLANRKKGQRGR
ncbi:MAG: IS66 family transposase, partial [Cytophagaceae bacterium]